MHTDMYTRRIAWAKIMLNLVVRVGDTRGGPLTALPESNWQSRTQLVSLELRATISLAGCLRLFNVSDL